MLLGPLSGRKGREARGLLRPAPFLDADVSSLHPLTFLLPCPSQTLVVVVVFLSPLPTFTDGLRFEVCVCGGERGGFFGPLDLKGIQ